MNDYQDRPEAYHRAARHGGRPEFPRRVIAVVDHRACSMAAVRHAIPFAAGSRHPLTVLLVKPERATITGLAAVAGLAVPPWWDDDLQAEFFASSAAVMASSGVTWDFGVLDRRCGVEFWIGDGRERSSLVVTARHREGLFGWYLRWRRLIRVGAVPGRTSAPLVVVDCDRDPRSDPDHAAGALR